MPKGKKTPKGFVSAAKNEVIDFSPMRERIDGLKKTVHSLPESKQKNVIMKELEGLYLWAGSYFNTFVAGVGLGTGANAEGNA